MLEQSHYEFCIFADNFNIARSFYGNCLVVIAALIETNANLLIQIVTNRKFTLTSVALSFLFALDKLIKFELFELFSFT